MPAYSLPLEQLTEDEITLIFSLNDRVNSFIDSTTKADQDRGPWAVVEERSSRTIAINGERGVGKTSLLLTLIDHWSRGSRDESNKDKKDKSNEDEEREKLRKNLFETGKNIRILKILDLDPLPNGLPIHAWLLEPWKKLVEDIDDPASLSGDQSDTLTDKYSKLYRRAIFGWSAFDKTGKSSVELELEARDQTDNWFTLRDNWLAFVSGILEKLENSRIGELCRTARDKAIIVVPIDDVDLQCDKLPELFHALRLFNHPRIVYLLTADMDHAREILELDYEKQHREAGGSSFVTEDRNQYRIRPRARSLATAQLEKTVPEGHSFLLEALSLKTLLKSTALAFKNCTIEEVIGEWYVKKNKDKNNLTLGNFLLSIAEFHDSDKLIKFRPLVQALEVEKGLLEQEKSAEKKEMPQAEEQRIEGEKADHTKHPLLVTLATGYPPKARRNLPGLVHIFTQIKNSSGEVMGGKICVGSKPVLEPEGAEDFRSPENLYFAHLLKMFFSDNIPSGLEILKHLPSPLFKQVFAWTKWIWRGKSVIYAWPFLEYPDIEKFYGSLKYWDSYDFTPAEVQGDIALKAWLDLQMKWKSPESESSLEKLSEVGRVKKKDELEKKEFDDIIMLDGEGKNIDDVWLNDELMYLTLPEYRLDQITRDSLLSVFVKIYESDESTTFNFSEKRRLELAGNAFEMGSSSDRGFAYRNRDLFYLDNDFAYRERESGAKEFLEYLDNSTKEKDHVKKVLGTLKRISVAKKTSRTTKKGEQSEK